jgi:hypothetical protein
VFGAYGADQPKRWVAMNIQSGRYVIILAEELHLGRAARKHYTAPQAFGRHVQRLEREIGVPLFDRTSRRVALTAAGERFVVRAQRVLAQVDDLAEVAAAEPPADTEVLQVGLLGFGLADKGLGIGVIDIKRLVVETPEQIIAGLRKALDHVPADRIHLTTDCGQFALPRQIARGKLAAMATAAEQPRSEISS